MDIACREQQTLDRQTEKYKKLVTIGLLAMCAAFMIVLLKAYLDGEFDSVDTFQKYVAGFGLIAPIFLVAFHTAKLNFQVLQVLMGF